MQNRVALAVLAAATASALVLTAGIAAAAPGNGNGSPPESPPGNPHASGTTGNPHAPGTTGNPHTGAPPYGQANGHADDGGQAGSGAVAGSSGGSASGGGGSAVTAAAPGGAADPGNGNGPPGKTTICHHTNSETNPYVLITVANPALQAHAKHGDLIPAPGGSCDEDDPAVQREIERSGAGGVLGESGSGTGSGEMSGTLAYEASSDPAGSGSAASSAQNGEEGGTLPFTGFAAMTLACIGILLACGGLLVRALNREPVA